MDPTDEILIILEPAQDVTDLEEWFAALQSVASLQASGRWSPRGDGVCARLPAAEFPEVAAAARSALGDAVVVRSDDGGITAVDIATGRPEAPPDGLPDGVLADLGVPGRLRPV